MQTVGLLVTAVSGAVARDRVTPEIRALAAGSSAAIDVVHVARRRIPPVYLVDAGIQLGFLAAFGRREFRERGPS